MEKLIQTILAIRQKLPALRTQGLKETPTRTILIDPLLQALGWDVRDPDEVELEYPTVDGKSVDYALKLNKNPVLLVEAKALGDALEYVKAVTQVVGYAANNGIAWCILTNGILWRVYRSMEQCPAPEKLMFEVNIAPDTSEAMSVEQIARLMWRFSREEMARGTLDALGEQTFTDGKVRKALECLMLNPPNKLLKLLRDAIGDTTLSPPRIKDSLARILGQLPPMGGTAVSTTPQVAEAPRPGRSAAAKRAWKTRKATRGESPYDEAHHLSGKPQEAVSLYRTIDQLCVSLEPSGVTRRYLAKSVNYEYANQCFCSVHVLQSGLRVWVPLRYKDVKEPPAFARDVAHVGHWGVGDTELRISNRSELEQAAVLIRQSFTQVKTS
ncbi:hypothetical protein [Thermopirellula anaerolimosa]